MHINTDPKYRTKIDRSTLFNVKKIRVLLNPQNCQVQKHTLNNKNQIFYKKIR